MSTAFVSYASEDSELVKELVREAEREGHHCWHFERDSMPSKTYLAEVSRAIDACNLFILLASPASLDSHQVTKEIEQAHEQQKQILPILYQVTSDDIRRQQPTWSVALGATVHVELTDEGLKPVIREVLRVCGTFPSEARRITTSWAGDAQLIDIDALDQVVVQTPAIKEFLQGDHQYFISANKGVGKTLLLKFKRSQLQHEHQVGGVHTRSEVVFMPKGKPFLDSMGGELPSLKKSNIAFLSTLRNCRRLWAFALRASILSHFPEHFAQLDSEKFAECVRLPIGEVVPDQAAATTVFRSLICQNVTDLNRLLDRMDTSIEYAFRGIHSAAFAFIDRVDQGISSLPQEAWINIQAGLVEAAWDVMNSNNHVKVYATIREEAYANYSSHSKNNLFSAILTLRYSLKELREMIDRLSSLYEAVPGFDAFVGIKSVENVHCRLQEDSFLYLHRHTVGRPRDLVIICSQLSSARRHLDECRFRDVVNEASATNIVKNLFAEMAVFLDCLRDAEARDRFFSLLPYNILKRSDLESICCKFNGLLGVPYADLENDACTISHPFCELYNCGLVGTVRENLEQGDVLQRFKQPHDIMSSCESCLPKADYYLLHPALQSLIHAQRAGAGYHSFRYVAVGHNYPWRGHHGELVELQRSLWEIPDVEIRKNTMKFVESTLSSTSGKVEPSSIDDRMLDNLLRAIERMNYDDVYLQLDRYISTIKTRRDAP